MLHNSKSNRAISLLLLICVCIITGCYSSSATTSTVSPTSLPSTRAKVMVMPEVSKGCGKTSAVSPGSSKVQVITSSGLTRSYLLHIPVGYKDTVQTPLVLNFHGHGSNALQQSLYTQFSTLADQQDFIVVYPQGVVGPDGHTGWATGPARNPQINDVLFVSNLLNQLQATLCINPSRIYATGFSNGGGMTNLLACKMADRIAAFAPVSGAYPSVPGGCHPARPVPIIEFHGTGDRIVPYNGSVVKGYPPVSEWLHSWVLLDHCSDTPILTQPASDITQEVWSHCSSGAALIHYRLTGWPHAWPRTTPVKHNVPRSVPTRTTGPTRRPTGSVTTSIDATPIIWLFFVAHPLPTKL